MEETVETIVSRRAVSQRREVETIKTIVSYHQQLSPKSATNNNPLSNG